MKKRKGLVFGRFQPFHNGHIDHISTAFKECDFVYIGITNPDPTKNKFTRNDPSRSLPESNPFSYFHRQQMIREVLTDLKRPLESFSILPFPINYPDLILNYAPQNATYYTTLLNSESDNKWNYEKIEILKSLKLEVKTVQSKRIISATSIRDMMKNNQQWEKFVPNAVSNYIKREKLLIGR